MGGLIQVLALVAIGIAPALAQPAARFAIEDVDRWLERLHASRGFSGAVVIERDGHVVYSRGVGVANDETRRMFTPDTRTDGGSLAKPFTATLLLMLAEEGAVDLQAPVRRYVNEYPDATTTVYELLSHQAALPDYDAFGALFRAGNPVTTVSMLTEAGRMATLAPHSGATRFAYCNLCFDTAALVVERVTGKRFDQVLRQQLFFSLGIEHAFIRPARLASMSPIAPSVTVFVTDVESVSMLRTSKGSTEAATSTRRPATSPGSRARSRSRQTLRV